MGDGGNTGKPAHAPPALCGVASARDVWRESHRIRPSSRRVMSLSGDGSFSLPTSFCGEKLPLLAATPEPSSALMVLCSCQCTAPGVSADSQVQTRQTRKSSAEVPSSREEPSSLVLQWDLSALRHRPPSLLQHRVTARHR